MNINILAVGKIKEEFYRNAVDEYLKRLSRFCKTSIIEVAEYPLNNNDIEKVIVEEGKRLLARSCGVLIALDLHGEMVSSEIIAERMEKCATDGNSSITFIIGGSHGLSQEVLSQCKYKFCFGKVTYPHQLMRVIVAEQIYRAFMINEKSPYHK